MQKPWLKKYRIAERGISVIALIVTILLLGSIGFLFSFLMVRSQESVPLTLDSTRAFSIADGGVSYVGKYLRNLGNIDWTTASVPPNQPLALGTGSFTVTFSPVNTNNLTVSVIGTSGSANRIVSASFQKTISGLSSLGGIDMGNNAGIDCGTVTCDNTNLASCPCVGVNIPASYMPIISLPVPIPGTFSLPAGPANCQFGVNFNNASNPIPSGTYYCSGGIELKNNAQVYLGGPVTIFAPSMTLNQNAEFNRYGLPANLLVIGVGPTVNITVENNAYFTGAIYAPGSQINLINVSVITGTIAGGISGDPDSIDISNVAQINYDPTAGQAAPLYTQTGTGGGILIVRLTNWQE